MAHKSYDDRRTDRINKGFDDRRRQRRASQTLREFSKVGGGKKDLETYEEMLDDMYEDLYPDD